MNAGYIFERVEIMICLTPHLIDRTQKVVFLYLQQHIVVQHLKDKLSDKYTVGTLGNNVWRPPGGNHNYNLNH